MADRTQEKTNGVVNDVKSALRGIRGAGDAIRGTVNESIDTAFNEREGETTNRAIKEKGQADLQATDQHFTHSGVAGGDTSASHPVGSGTGPSTGGLSGTKRTVGGTTTGAGAHSGSVGNMGSSVPQTDLGGLSSPKGGSFAFIALDCRDFQGVENLKMAKHRRKRSPRPTKMTKDLANDVGFGETSTPDDKSTLVTVKGSAAMLSSFTSFPFLPQRSNAPKFGQPGFIAFDRGGSATLFGSSSISSPFLPAERPFSFDSGSGTKPFTFKASTLQSTQPAKAFVEQDRAASATSQFRREEGNLHAAGGYMQLIQAGPREFNGDGVNHAKLGEIKTTPLFSEQVCLALKAGIMQSLGSDEDPFPQFGLLGLREETYNSRHTGTPQTLPLQQNMVFANMNAPWSTFICGSQGAGKSHSLSCLLENALLTTSSAGVNPRPLAGLVFHFDKFTSFDSTQVCEAAYLCSAGVPVRVLVSPSNFYAMHKLYRNLPGLPKNCPKPQVIPLRFREQQLNVTRLMTLMAVNGDVQSPLYLEVLYKILRDMVRENKGSNGLDYIQFKSRLDAQGFSAAQNGPLRLRLQLLEEFLAPREQSMQSTNLLDRVFHSAQGSLTIVDLSCPFVNENDACALFNICLSIFMENRGECGRVIALDEAHKFLTKSGEADKLTDQLISLIRQQRHLATRVIVATQEPTLSPSLLDLCNVSIVHRINSPAWFCMLRDHLAGACLNGNSKDDGLFETIVGLQTGEALVFCPSALLDVGRGGGGDIDTLKDAFIKIRIRSRVTVDGGKSIMASDKMDFVVAEEPAIQGLLQPFSVPENSVVQKRVVLAPKSRRISSTQDTSNSAAQAIPVTVNQKSSAPGRVQHQGPVTAPAVGSADYSRAVAYLQEEVTRSLLENPNSLAYSRVRNAAASASGWPVACFMEKWASKVIRAQAEKHAQAHGNKMPKLA